MAGSNKILKAGTILFRAGDPSDGMYIIRKGELRVYLEQAGKEVKLASVGDGGILGEMALFDNKPRSAYVKAEKDTEVTLISNQDFQQLMKQIPKWFVSLMATLSMRLRTTNERLQALEKGGGAAAQPTASGGTQAIGEVLRSVNILALLWHRDGEKGAKDWTLPKEKAIEALLEAGESEQRLKNILDVLAKGEMIALKPGPNKTDVFIQPRRGVLAHFVKFANAFARSHPKSPFLNASAIAVLDILEEQSNAAVYAKVVIPVTTILEIGGKKGLNTADWVVSMEPLRSATTEAISLQKQGNDWVLRVAKEELPGAVRYHRTLSALGRIA